MNSLLIRFCLFAKSSPQFGDHRSDWTWEWAKEFYGGWLDVREGEWQGEDYAFLNTLIERGLLRSYSVVRRWDKDHFSSNEYLYQDRSA